MVLSDLLLTFLSFWALIHVIYRVVLQRKPSNGIRQNLSRITTDVLPVANVNHTSPPTEITLSYFCLYYKTTKFNTYFESLAKKAPKFWKIWFNIGVLVGILAMIIGIGVMIVAGWKLLVGVIGSFGLSTWNHRTHDVSYSPPQTKFVKRSGDMNHQVENNNKDHQVFIPVIPGVTLPISHLIYYLIALSICGIIHEAGHAIAAYSESVPINYAGLFLYFFYPGAFVNFSDQHFNKRSLIKKLRILCAGVWHNLIIFLFGLFILNAGILTFLMSFTGYRSVRGIGVSIIDVEGSDFSGILYPSTLITKLDDYELDGNSLERWNDFFSPNVKIKKSNYGFCASEKGIVPSLDCCDITTAHPYGNSENREISCFQRSDPKSPRYQELSCLHATPILVNMDEQRCRRDSDCDNPSPICVLPYTPAGFPTPVRIYFKHPFVNQEESREQVLLWFGNIEDLEKILQVSILQPRWSWVPLWIPITLELTLRYTVSFSLALCVLNILPAFQLDGHHVLTAILTWLYEVDDKVETSTTISISKRKKQRKKLENGIVYGVTGLVGWVAFGTLISGIFFEGY